MSFSSGDQLLSGCLGFLAKHKPDILTWPFNLNYLNFWGKNNSKVDGQEEVLQISASQNVLTIIV